MGDWEEQENAQAEIVAKLSQHSEATDSYAMDAGSIVIEFRDRKDMLICIVEPGSFQMLWRDKGRFYSCALPGLSFSTAAAIDAVNSHFDR